MIYLVLADGFEEIEALTVVDVMRRAGLDIKTVGITGGFVRGSHGIKVEADIDASREFPDTKDVNMIVFPGGMPGASNIDSYPEIGNIIKIVISRGGFAGAICAAPMILGKRGFLDGKRAICFPGFEKDLVGAVITDEDVVIDRPFVTSRCMGTALDFAIGLVEVLTDRENAQKIKKSVMGGK